MQQGVTDYGVDNVIYNASQNNWAASSSKRVSFTKVDAPSVSESLFKNAIQVPIEFPVNLQNSSVTCLTPPTAPYTITFTKNGVPFATADFPALATTASLTAASTIFATGDVLEIIAPNPDDTAISYITFDLSASTN